MDVDLIGPWKVQIDNAEYKFRALTCIDPIISLSEIIPIEKATSRATARAFENEWLSRYPRPSRCSHDNGNEFLGQEFQDMLRQNGIRSTPTTVKNPQANATVERLHQNISKMIGMAMQENPPNDLMEAREVIRSKCMAAQFANRDSFHKILKLQPGQLAFGRDMLSPFRIQVDWNQLLRQRQTMSDKNTIRENHGRRHHDYTVNDRVLILNKEPMRGKLAPVTLDEGPWSITQIFANGTVNINRNGYVERINIRRLRPFNN